MLIVDVSDRQTGTSQDRECSRSPARRLELNVRVSIFAASRACVGFGRGVGWIALVFGTLAMPGASASTLAIVVALQVAPQVPATMFGGVLGDRLARGRLIATCQLTSAVALMCIALVMSVHTSSFVLLGALVCVAGSLDALSQPAAASIVPELVGREALQQGNILVRASQNVSSLAGLAFGGVLVANFGGAVGLTIHALLLLSSCSLMLMLGLSRARVSPSRAGGGVFRDLKAGFRYVVGISWLLVFGLQSTLLEGAWNATESVLGPTIAENHYSGATAWSLITAAVALGALAGAAVVWRIVTDRTVIVTVACGYLLALPLLCLWSGQNLAVVVVAAFCCGVGNEVVEVLWITAVQKNVSEDMLSRTVACITLGRAGISPMAILLVGPLCAVVGDREAVGVCAVVIVGTTTIALCFKSVNLVDRSQSGC